MGNSPLRVLRVIGGLEAVVGGPSESSVNICIATERAGVRNTFILPVNTETFSGAAIARRRLFEAGVTVKMFPLAGVASDASRRWGVSRSLARWIFAHVHEYDVVHLHAAWGFGQLAGVLAARAHRVPCVLTPHEALTSYDIHHLPRTRLRPTAKKALRRLYFRAISLIVFSSWIEERDSLEGDSSVSTVVIPHPVGDLLDAPAPHTEQSLPSGGMRIGYLGRLHPKKNIDILISCLSAIDGVRLCIAGAGDPGERQRLERHATNLGVAGRVEWAGFVPGSRRAAFLDSVDVLAVPSEYECFGMVAAEGLARGVPTVVSASAGISHLVARHDAGLIAFPTVDAFARALTRLRDEPSLRASLAARGRAAAETELSLATHGKRMLNKYREVVGRAAAQSD